MNDIASASDKGRRTIYTYFKSKRDIFNAVIESESDRMLERLRGIVELHLPPDRKFYEYVQCRFSAMREIVRRNGSLRAGFFRDVRKVDRARSIIADKEAELVGRILREGDALGVFHVRDVKTTAMIITQAIHGLDVPYIRDALADKGLDKENLAKYFTEVLLKGLLSREDSDDLLI